MREHTLALESTCFGMNFVQSGDCLRGRGCRVEVYVCELTSCDEEYISPTPRVRKIRTR